jgi:acyl dehydratase
MGGGLSGLKLDKCRVLDGEDIVGWLEDAEMYFDLRKVPEEFKMAPTVFSLQGDAKAFYRCGGDRCAVLSA